MNGAGVVMFAANSGASSVYMSKGRTQRISSISHNSHLTEHRGSSASYENRDEQARIVADMHTDRESKVRTTSLQTGREKMPGLTLVTV